MRPSYCENMPIAKHVVGQPLRPGHVGAAAIQNSLHQRVPARDDVAYDPHVRRQRNLVSVITLDHAHIRRPTSWSLIGGYTFTSQPLTT